MTSNAPPEIVSWRDLTLETRVRSAGGEKEGFRLVRDGLPSRFFRKYIARTFNLDVDCRFVCPSSACGDTVVRYLEEDAEFVNPEAVFGEAVPGPHYGVAYTAGGNVDCPENERCAWNWLTSWRDGSVIVTQGDCRSTDVQSVHHYPRPMIDYAGAFWIDTTYSGMTQVIEWSDRHGRPNQDANWVDVHGYTALDYNDEIWTSPELMASVRAMFDAAAYGPWRTIPAGFFRFDTFHQNETAFIGRYLGEPATDQFGPREEDYTLQQVEYRLTFPSREGVLHEVRWFERFTSADCSSEALEEKVALIEGTGGIVSTPVHTLAVPSESRGNKEVLIAPPGDYAFMLEDVRFHPGLIDLSRGFAAQATVGKVPIYQSPIAAARPDPASFGFFVPEPAICSPPPPFPQWDAQLNAEFDAYGQLGGLINSHQMDQSNELFPVRWSLHPYEGRGLDLCAIDPDTGQIVAFGFPGKVWVRATALDFPALFSEAVLEISCGPECKRPWSDRLSREGMEAEIALGAVGASQDALRLAMTQKEPGPAFAALEHWRLPAHHYAADYDLSTRSSWVLTSRQFSTEVSTSNGVVHINRYPATDADGMPRSSQGAPEGAGQRSEPLTTWQINAPGADAGDFTALLVTQSDGVTGEAFTSRYTWVASNQGWTLERGDGAEIVEQVNRYESGGTERVLDETIGHRDATGTVVVDRKTRNTFERLPVGDVLTRSVRDPDGAALDTVYQYYTDTNDTARLGKTRSIEYPDGYWEAFTYTDDGFRESVLSPWEDLPLSEADASTGVATRYEYLPHDPLDDGTLYPSLPRTETVTVAGVLYARIYHAYMADGPDWVEVTEICSDPKDLYQHPENLRTVVVRSRLGADRVNLDPDTGQVIREDHRGPGAGRIRRIDYSDGRTVSFDYARGTFIPDPFDPGASVFSPAAWGEAERVTTTYGTHAHPEGLADQTTRTELIYNEFGLPALERMYVYTGNEAYDLVRWSATEYDPATLLSYVQHSSIGTTTEVARSSCCRATDVTDAQGVRIRLERDEIGRTGRLRRLGMAGIPGIPEDDQVVEWVYDGTGAPVQEIRFAGSGSRPALVDAAGYDAAGRSTSRTDPAGARMEWAYPASGRTQTARLPGGGLVVQSNRLDRLPSRITGSAVTDRFYSYAADEGEFHVDIREGREDGPRRHRMATDGIGRIRWEEHPSPGGGTLRTDYEYLDRGLLTAVKTSGEPPMRFEYDALGRLVRAGLDLDASNQPGLQPGGVDRIIDMEPRFVLDRSDGSWWSAAETTTYPEVGQSARKPLGSIRTRLSGYPPGVVSETIHTDVFGNQSTQRTSVVRSERRRVIERVDAVSADPDRLEIINGFPHRRRDPRGRLTEYDYGDVGRVQGVMDSAQTGIVRMVYNDQGRLVSHQAANGPTVQFEYDPETGQLVQLSNGAGREIRFAYSPRSQVTHRWGSGVYPLQLEYDAWGRVIRTHAFRGDAEWGGPDWPGESGGAADVTAWDYEEATGLPVAKTYADGARLGFVYDPQGRLWQRTSARNEASGLSTTFAYTRAGEVSAVDYPDAGTPDLLMTYDRLGRPTSIEDGAGSRSISYNADLQPERERVSGAPDLVWDYADGPEALRGRLRGFDYGGALTTLSYDPLGRLSGVGSGDVGVEVDFVPETSIARTRTLRINGLTGIESISHFDGRLRLLDTTHRFSGPLAGRPEAQLRYEYDGFSRREASILPDGTRWSFGYNDRGELMRAQRRFADGVPVPGQIYDYRFDPAGNLVERVDNDDPVGRIHRFDVGPGNLLRQIDRPGWVDVAGMAQDGSAVTVNYQPADRFGPYFHRAVRVRTDGAPAAKEIVVHAVTPGAGQGGVDRVERRRGVAFVPENPETLAYDADGNRVRDGRWTYTWDDTDRLVSIETRSDLPPDIPRYRTECVYDYQGRRIRREVYRFDEHDGRWRPWIRSRFHYAGRLMVREERTDETGPSAVESETDYVWGPDLSGSLQGAGGIGGLVSAVRRASNVPTPLRYVFHYDGRGNVAGLVDIDTGDTLAQYEYGPFGRLLRAEGPLARINPFRFSTKYFDAETSLYDFGYRYYDPNTARWLSRDPLGETAGLNLTSFVHNDPINHIDPLGLALYAFDGTWQHFQSSNQHPTNVRLFFEAYNEPRGRNVVNRYYGGIGNEIDYPNLCYQLFAGLTGHGGHEILEIAYSHLVENWQNGDRQIDLVGFSRGGALAIAFANLVQERGIPQIERARPSVGNMNSFLAASGQVHFNFVGVWDPVGSFGIARNLLGIPFQQWNLGYDFSTPQNARAIVSALALDENREAFLPITLPGAIQCWFEGNHGQVGGGGLRRDNPDHGLSDIALSWMMEEASALAGIEFSLESIRRLNPHVGEHVDLDNRSALFGNQTRRVQTGDLIHHSVRLPQPLGLNDPVPMWPRFDIPEHFEISNLGGP